MVFSLVQVEELIVEHLRVCGFVETGRVFERERQEKHLASECGKKALSAVSESPSFTQEPSAQETSAQETPLSQLHCRLNSLIKLQQKLLLSRPQTAIPTFSHCSQSILRGHTSSATTLDLHHSLPLLASASDNECTIRLWNHSSQLQEPVCTLLAHADSVMHLQFHPTASTPALLASCSADGSVACFRMNDLGAWSAIGFVCWHDECVKAVCWLPGTVQKEQAFIEASNQKFLLASLSVDGAFAVTQLDCTSAHSAKQVFSLEQVQCFAAVGDWLVVVNEQDTTNVDFYFSFQKTATLHSPIAIEACKSIAHNAAVAWNKAGQLIVLYCMKREWEIVALTSFDWIIDCCPFGNERGFLVAGLGKESLVYCHGAQWKGRESCIGEVKGPSQRATCLSSAGSLLATGLTDSSIVLLRDAK